MQAFSLVQETEVPELNTLVRLYRHDRSGAQVMSLINDDENKSFGIAFRTLTPHCYLGRREGCAER